jgi:hypothetical protein
MTREKFQIVFLNQLTKRKQNRRVLFIRIIRLWVTYNAQRPGELMSIDFFGVGYKGKMFSCMCGTYVAVKIAIIHISFNNSLYVSIGKH